jgi:hypothetical protein
VCVHVKRIQLSARAGFEYGNSDLGTEIAVLPRQIISLPPFLVAGIYIQGKGKLEEVYKISLELFSRSMPTE